MNKNDRIKVLVGVFKSKKGTVINVVPKQEKSICTVLDSDKTVCVWFRPHEIENE